VWIFLFEWYNGNMEEIRGKFMTQLSWVIGQLSWPRGGESD
jgi:hypothetical protein